MRWPELTQSRIHCIALGNNGFAVPSPQFSPWPVLRPPSSVRPAFPVFPVSFPSPLPSPPLPSPPPCSHCSQGVRELAYLALGVISPASPQDLSPSIPIHPYPYYVPLHPLHLPIHSEFLMETQDAGKGSSPRRGSRAQESRFRKRRARGRLRNPKASRFVSSQPRRLAMDWYSIGSRRPRRLL